MNAKELLIKSAETIEAQQATIVDLTAKLAASETEKVTLSQHISQTKEAGDQSVAASDKEKAEIAELAKTAAEKLRSRGLLANQERADKFASEIINDRKQVYQALAKVADHVNTMPSLGKAAHASETDQPVESADATWDRLANSALSTLGTGR